MPTPKLMDAKKKSTSALPMIGQHVCLLIDALYCRVGNSRALLATRHFSLVRLICKLMANVFLFLLGIVSTIRFSLSL